MDSPPIQSPGARTGPRNLGKMGLSGLPRRVIVREYVAGLDNPGAGSGSTACRTAIGRISASSCREGSG